MASVPNVADPQEVKKSVERALRGRDLELDDFAWVMSNERGRRFVYRYISECGVFKTSFTGNSTTFFNEGARNIGLKIMADINEACPEQYQTMLAEARAREKTQG
jgi:3-oxoacyl-[acyl-carrier-protein] synthase III